MRRLVAGQGEDKGHENDRPAKFFQSTKIDVCSYSCYDLPSIFAKTLTKPLIFMVSKWIVHDRYGNEIYLTQERWHYILRYHPQLDGLHDELLDALREGRRRQQPDAPVRYKYYHYSVHLPPEYNTIVVVVKFTTQLQADGTLASNNFVITAWATYIFREG